MLKEEPAKNFKKALTSLKKVKVTSCILPQRNSNSVEKLIRYRFIHKGFRLIHEELPDLSIYIAFLVPSLEQMFKERYFRHPRLSSPIFSKFSL